MPKTSQNLVLSETDHAFWMQNEAFVTGKKQHSTFENQRSNDFQLPPEAVIQQKPWRLLLRLLARLDLLDAFQQLFSCYIPAIVCFLKELSEFKV